MTHIAVQVAERVGCDVDGKSRSATLRRQLEEAGLRHDLMDETFFASWLARSRSAMGDTDLEATRAAGWALTYPAAMAELDTWLAVAGSESS